MKDSIEFERTFGAALICLYPIMPAYSAQLWQSFRGVATFSEPEFNLVSNQNHFQVPNFF
jgi:hypothetical protein